MQLYAGAGCGYESSEDDDSASETSEGWQEEQHEYAPSHLPTHFLGREQSIVVGGLFDVRGFRIWLPDFI